MLTAGSGKTIIFCHLARALNRRTLILAHRVELLQQTADKMRLVWPEASKAVGWAGGQAGWLAGRLASLASRLSCWQAG